VNLSQNDPLVAVALTKPMLYSQVYGQTFLHFQSSDIWRSGNTSRYEPTTRGKRGVRSTYGQARAFRGLCFFGWVDAFGLAKDLGWYNIHSARDFWNWNRICSAFHGYWANGLSCRHICQYFGSGARPRHISYFLDSTPTLTRRFPCAA